MLHTLSIWLHVLSACIWIGGMAALGLLLLPVLRRDRFADISDALFYAAALRFRWIGWGALGVLIVTGLFNVRAQIPWTAWVDLSFWTTAWGAALGWKLGLVVLTLLVSAVHDFWMGPRALELMKTAPDDPTTEWMRWGSSWLGRLTLVLSLAILWLAVLLPRGGLP